jgi:predicted nucleotidyltransferase
MVTLSEDYLDFLKALNRSQVRYLVVGGMAVVVYGVDRTTGDMDIWVENSPKNHQALKSALILMQYLPEDVDEALAAYQKQGKLTIVLDEKFPIEMMPSYSSFISFDKAYESKIEVDFSGIPLSVVDLDTLIDMKIRAGREKDLWDVKHLQEKKRK